MESKRGIKKKIRGKKRKRRLEGVKKIYSDPQSMTYKTKFKKKRDLQKPKQKKLERIRSLWALA